MATTNGVELRPRAAGTELPGGARRARARKDGSPPAAVLASAIGNRAFGRLVQRAPPKGPLPPPERQLPPGPDLPAGVQMVDLNKLQYSQEDISWSYEDEGTGTVRSVARMAADMRKTGWDPHRPADVVEMSDGRLVSVDHRRLWAAEKAGIKQVSVRIHKAGDKISGDAAARFAIRKGKVPSGTNPVTNNPWKAGDGPGTWGDAMRFRAALQEVVSKTQKWRNRGPRALHGGEARDPSFPAEGSPHMPSRTAPGVKYERLPGASGAPPGKGKPGATPPSTPHAPPSTAASAPHAEEETPAIPATSPRPGRTRVGIAGAGAEPEPELEEGGGMTAEEMDALTGPDGFEGMMGRGNWSLLSLIGSMVLSDYFSSQAREIEQLTIDRVKQGISTRLAALAYMIIGLQVKGEIAYAQITVKKTVTDTATVFDLESVVVSDWYKQDHDSSGAGLGVQTDTDTSSFALNLHPAVLSIAMAELATRLRDVDAQIAKVQQSGQSVPASLQEQRRKIQSCATRLAKLGPQKPSFGFVAGDCLDLLPTTVPAH